MTDAVGADAVSLAAGVRDGSWTAMALVQAALDRIGRHDPLLNCFTGLRARAALDDAARLDAARAGGAALGPLARVPFAAKNLFDVAGVTTLAGSRVLAAAPAAGQDAAMVSRPRAAGAILPGQTNMDEFAYGFPTETPIAAPPQTGTIRTAWPAARPRRSPPGCCRSPWVPTPTARCGRRPRCAACSG